MINYVKSLKDNELSNEENLSQNYLVETFNEYLKKKKVNADSLFDIINNRSKKISKLGFKQMLQTFEIFSVNEINALTEIVGGDSDFVNVKMLKQLEIGDNIYEDNEMHPLENQLQMYMMNNDMNKQ